MIKIMDRFSIGGLSGTFFSLAASDVSTTVQGYQTPLAFWAGVFGCVAAFLTCIYIALGIMLRIKNLIDKQNENESED